MALDTIDLKQGNTFNRVFQWRDVNGDAIDLTGCSGTFALMDRSTNTVVLSGTTETGEISISGTNGDVEVTLPASGTTSLGIKKYDSDLTLVFTNGYTVSTETFFINVKRKIS